MRLVGSRNVLIRKESLLAYKLLVFDYILQKNPQKLTPLLKATFCPCLLCLPCLYYTLLDLKLDLEVFSCYKYSRMLNFY